MSDVSRTYNFFLGSNQLVIPVYQRNYDWKEANCRQLFNDLVDLIDSKPRKNADGDDIVSRHFLGAVIYNKGTNDTRIVIDGQQRLTTIALFLIALRDAVENGDVSFADGSNMQRLKDHLYDPSNDYRPTLIPARSDIKAYNALLNSEEYIETSKMTSNYHFFYDSIIRFCNDRSCNADILFTKLNKFWFMPIELSVDEGDDAQSVFESINTTGMTLKDADRIRNYVMMNRRPKDQDRIYSIYWETIQTNLANLDVSMFFRYYLMASSSKIVKESEVYEKFKELKSVTKNSGDEGDSVLKEIKDYSKIYKDICLNTAALSIEASRSLLYINHLGLTISYPVIMRLIYEQQLGNVDSIDVNESIIAIENYLVRRTAIHAYSTGLNSVFGSLYKNVSMLEGDGSFTEKLKYVLLKKEGAVAYPNDEVVRDNLGNMPLYDSKASCRVILSIVNRNNDDSSDVLPRINSDDLTIEHVMPQTLDSEWKDYLGEDWERIHETWLHKIGNLTLSAYNGKYSNSQYAEKLHLLEDGKKVGLADSDLFLNVKFKTETEWKEEQIRDRTNWAVDQFISNRPMLITSYTPPVKEETYVDIMYGDLTALSGTAVYAYSINDNRFDSKNAVDAYVKIMTEICNIYHEELSSMEETKARGDVSYFFGKDENDDYTSIGHGLFLYTSTGNINKFKTLRGVINKLGIDDWDVKVFYKKRVRD